MEIEFLKMQGCGDDTLLIDCFKQSPPPDEQLARLARRMLDRKRGVGANSLLLLSPGRASRISARAFSTSGAAAAVSFNALRCAARYASDSGTSVDRVFPIETPSGDFGVEIIDSVNVRLDMGAPMSRELGTEIREKPLDSFTRAIVVQGKSVTYTPVSLTASYGIVFVPAFDFPFPRTARSILSHPDFPAQTGVGFVQLYSREKIRMRDWQPAGGSAMEMEPTAGPLDSHRRGGGEEPASCPAAAAAVVASVVNGFTDREVFVHLAGGDVFIQWDERDNRLYLTGPAAYVFTGTFYFEEEEH